MDLNYWRTFNWWVLWHVILNNRNTEYICTRHWTRTCQILSSSFSRTCEWPPVVSQVLITQPAHYAQDFTDSTELFCWGYGLPIRVHRARFNIAWRPHRMSHCHCHCHCHLSSFLEGWYLHDRTAFNIVTQDKTTQRTQGNQHNQKQPKKTYNNPNETKKTNNSKTIRK